jgi:hypothetical protein
MKSFFDTPRKSEINPPAADQFLYPIFHYSTIPPFHWTSKGKLHPSGGKSKPGPLGSDSILISSIIKFTLAVYFLNEGSGRFSRIEHRSPDFLRLKEGVLFEKVTS